MREFCMISPTVWNSGRFRTLSGDDARLLFLYLLSSPHGNSAGLFTLRPGYACDDLQWPLERYRTALQALVAAGMVEEDPDCSVLRLTRWFKHCPPANESHLAGIRKEARRQPSSRLAETAIREAETAWAAGEVSRVAKRQRSLSKRQPEKSNQVEGFQRAADAIPNIRALGRRAE